MGSEDLRHPDPLTACPALTHAPPPPRRGLGLFVPHKGRLHLSFPSSGSARRVGDLQSAGAEVFQMLQSRLPPSPTTRRPCWRGGCETPEPYCLGLWEVLPSSLGVVSSCLETSCSSEANCARESQSPGGAQTLCPPPTVSGPLTTGLMPACPKGVTGIVPAGWGSFSFYIMMVKLYVRTIMTNTTD